MATLLLTALGACAPDGSTGSDRSASVPRKATAVPDLHLSEARAGDCFAGSGATVHRQSGTPRSRIVTLGSGPRGVVLAPISWGNACEWAAEAKRLAASGYRVASVDWGSDRQSTVLQATRLLRTEGADQVVWVGGCMGGNVMLGLAPAAGAADRPVGVAGISPLASLGGYTDSASADYDGRLFLLGTADDPLADARRLREVAASFPGAEVVVLPGRLHAAEIFAGPHADRARKELDAFLERSFAHATT
ncbi:hypothetical protein JK359_23825 [Streptomyces actinomycinicus]|uniref:Alpha/beta hydrolase n=1 Tax=Streptomyces actinomycinicus TaxID=1695166 RepID=A0A937EN02_9ACTN|nr:hypothetical protein [Streptomyces actinomycinicus]MBL1084964.1 hypothetical protein [Streptomyces actinomycinicus]